MDEDPRAARASDGVRPAADGAEGHLTERWPSLAARADAVIALLAAGNFRACDLSRITARYSGYSGDAADQHAASGRSRWVVLPTPVTLRENTAL